MCVRTSKTVVVCPAVGRGGRRRLRLGRLRRRRSRCRHSCRLLPGRDRCEALPPVKSVGESCHRHLPNFRLLRQGPSPLVSPPPDRCTQPWPAQPRHRQPHQPIGSANVYVLLPPRRPAPRQRGVEHPSQPEARQPRDALVRVLKLSLVGGAVAAQVAVDLSVSVQSRVGVWLGPAVSCCTGVQGRSSAGAGGGASWAYEA